MIRDATIHDAPGGSAVLRAAYPDMLATPAGTAHRMRCVPDSARPRFMVADVDGETVGWAMAALDWSSTTPTDAFAGVIVHPAHRRRGVGSALWEQVAGHLEAVGANVLRMHGDAGCTAFAEARGFVLTSTNTVLRLDPAGLPPAPAPPAGVTVEPTVAHLADPEALFAADYATMQDEPGDHDFAGVTFRDWAKELLEHPDFDAELSTVAVSDGRVVGLSHLFTDRGAGKAFNGGTGVVASHRGRGIATALKRGSLERATRAGIRNVFTVNDDTNAPMLAINSRLGYAVFASRTSWRRDPLTRV